MMPPVPEHHPATPLLDPQLLAHLPGQGHEEGAVWHIWRVRHVSE